MVRLLGVVSPAAGGALLRRCCSIKQSQVVYSSCSIVPNSTTAYITSPGVLVPDNPTLRKTFVTTTTSSLSFLSNAGDEKNRNMETTKTTTMTKPPVPPFSYNDAVEKVRMAENAWNTRDPDKVKMAYTVDSEWRNRSTFLKGREEIGKFLSDKWNREQEYRLIKEIWVHSDDRIAVRFAYEYYHKNQADHHGNGGGGGGNSWFRAYGNENWEFDTQGLMKKRHASINDVPITESERLFHWPWDAPRPEDHPGLTELGL